MVRPHDFQRSFAPVGGRDKYRARLLLEPWVPRSTSSPATYSSISLPILFLVCRNGLNTPDEAATDVRAGEFSLRELQQSAWGRHPALAQARAGPSGLAL